MAITIFIHSFTLLLLFSTAIDALHHHHHRHHHEPPQDHHHDHDHHSRYHHEPPQDHHHDHDDHHHHHRHNHHHRHDNDRNVKILLPQVLSQLGFLDLATAASALSSSTAAEWPAGPSTVFAPSDASLRSSCGVSASCPLADILREHVVPGIFSADSLQNLSAGAKIETLSQGHCLTVTTKTDKNQTESSTKKIYVAGVEITHADLFNDDLIAVHGLRGLIAPLSPFSCDYHHHHNNHDHHDDNQDRDHDSAYQQSLHFSLHPNFPPDSTAIMRLMLRDAIMRLRSSGYGVLALAMRIKYPELVRLDTMTVFAINDVSIFSGGLHSYVGNVRFHIVPNSYLTMADLEKLPLGTILETLAEGQSIVVTSAGYGGLSPAPMRINYVRIRVPEVIRNFKIIVHSLFVPFPHIRSGDGGGRRGGGFIGELKNTRLAASGNEIDEGMACGDSDDFREGVGGRVCLADHLDHVLVPPEKPTVEIEDHHGL